jgi:hypothetical protein
VLKRSGSEAGRARRAIDRTMGVRRSEDQASFARDSKYRSSRGARQSATSSPRFSPPPPAFGSIGDSVHAAERDVRADAAERRHRDERPRGDACQGLRVPAHALRERGGGPADDLDG